MLFRMSRIKEACFRKRLLFLVVPSEAAVEEECGAGGVSRFVRSEEDCHVGDVFGSAKSAQRDIL